MTNCHCKRLFLAENNSRRISSTTAYYSFHNYCVYKIIGFQELDKKIQSTKASFYVNAAQHTDLRLHQNNRKITLLARDELVQFTRKKMDDEIKMRPTVTSLEVIPYFHVFIRKAPRSL